MLFGVRRGMQWLGRSKYSRYLLSQDSIAAVLETPAAQRESLMARLALTPTTTGTTAHVFLDNALRANKLDPGKDVEILNQRMAEAVTSFISGAVPAVALWVPFNVTVRDKVPGARKLVDASAYYPQAANVSGWAASNDFHAKNKDALARVVRGDGQPNKLIEVPGLSLAELHAALHKPPG